MTAISALIDAEVADIRARWSAPSAAATYTCDRHPADAVALRAGVKARYGAHATPATIEVLDALPRTPSGKVNRFELRAWDVRRAATAGPRRRRRPRRHRAGPPRRRRRS